MLITENNDKSYSRFYCSEQTFIKKKLFQTHDEKMSSYSLYIACFECHTVEQLYEKLESVAKTHLKLNKIPFPIEYLEQEYRHEVGEFLYKCLKLYQNDNSDESAKELIRFLKKNSPKEIQGNQFVKTKIKVSRFQFLKYIIILFIIDQWVL